MKLLATREDIFNEYTIEKFEAEFKKSFSIEEKIKLEDSERFLYIMKKK